MLPPVTQELRADPPLLHGSGQRYFGLAWPALAWLEEYVTEGMKTLETGCGGSTVVFAAAGADHVAITPAAEEHERLKAYCDERGIDTSRVRFIAESSHVALLKVWKPEPLDLVLADGAHAFPFPALDWFHTAEHLKVGGSVLLDDAFLPSVHIVVKFLRQSPAWEFEGALGPRTVRFRKLTENMEMDATATRFDRIPRFDYLPPAQRAGAWARHAVDRSKTLQRLLRLRSG